ncbi:synaptotagmin-A-like [Dendronephthya gigantea]|uniref:synaptotagmin-A-like n=1 Tax=Dendronephthya gigantea TaxID=151771 RepID=UPI001069DFE0|nr:synaptotagmin-A-like [Dendronephthya gigantea]
MQGEYFLPISLGIGTGLLLLLFLYLLYKLTLNRGFQLQKRPKKPMALNRTPTILPHDIPGFSLPLTRKVPVQDRVRTMSNDELSSEEYEIDSIGTRTNNNVPVTTATYATQSNPNITQEISKMEPLSPLKRKSVKKALSGSISLQDLNLLYSPKTRRVSVIDEDMQANLKFALYYCIASSELNVTVISVHHITMLKDLTEEPNVCVWVQVEFSGYHQEFRTKYCSCVNVDELVFHETCVVSDFPADLFNGTKISFRVLDNATVVAEAVHVVLGLPPSFPRNEIIELQHPGIVQTSQSPKCGDILVRLKYDPVVDSVTLEIVECRNLRSPLKKKKLLDTYVKIHVIFCDKIVQRLKTRMVTKCNSPTYKETFHLSGFFSRGKMKQVLVKLTVFSKSVTKQGIGYVFLGTGRQNDITASGYQHWETIIDKPQLSIAQWHALKPVRTVTP